MGPLQYIFFDYCMNDFFFDEANCMLLFFFLTFNRKSARQHYSVSLLTQKEILSLNDLNILQISQTHNDIILSIPIYQQVLMDQHHTH